jgi:hypothetical protein
MATVCAGRCMIGKDALFAESVTLLRRVSPRKLFQEKFPCLA